jgi:hypothetical protein
MVIDRKHELTAFVGTPSSLFVYVTNIRGSEIRDFH